MGRQRSRFQLDTMDDINLTPMMDLVFLLLIVFMITTPLMENAIEIELPKQSAAEPSDETPKTISLTKDNRLYYGGEEIQQDELIEMLLNLQKTSPDLNIAFYGDGDCLYKEVTRIFGYLTKAGITNVSLMTEPTPE